MSGRMHRERMGENRLNGMILISLFFHGVILSLLFFTPSFPSPKMTFGPIYTVSLVNFSGNVLAQKSGTTTAKELLEPLNSETVFKKQLAQQEPIIPIRSLEIRRKQHPDLEKAMQKIRKRVSASAVAPKPQEKTSREAKTDTAFSPSPGDAEMDSKMRAYYAMVWSRIKGGWALPQGILPGEVLETVINVTILRSGAVTEMNFEKRSGNRYFDESALKAIRKSVPFPPLPAWINESRLDVGIRFYSSELRS
jgi:colicin import membrane protein